MADTVVLGVVELVTNVLKHTDSGCEVTLSAPMNEVLVTVTDFDQSLPVVRTADDDQAESGRGLLLLSLLADDLSVELLPSGKRVGFRLATAEEEHRRVGAVDPRRQLCGPDPRVAPGVHVLPTATDAQAARADSRPERSPQVTRSH